MENQENQIEKLAGTKVSFVMPDTESLGQLDSMGKQFNLTMKYRTTDDWAVLKDVPVRAFYMGIKSIPNENGELVNCGVFITQKECFISGQMLLLDAVQNLIPKTPIEIIYRGKTKNKTTDGMTCVFEVSKLN
jgi:hypothetical protein